MTKHRSEPGRSAPRLSRRGTLALLAGAAAAPAFAQPRLAPEPIANLGTAATAARILFGASIAGEGVTEAAYSRLYASETRIVTTDYAMKFDAMRPDEHDFDFGETDAIVDFAARHALLVRGHTLVWNENAPPWLKARPKSEIGAIMDRHIETVMGRYGSRIHSWDVVNEPFWPDHGAPGGFRRGPWFDALGPDYVARAFRRAASTDPKARLVLNEAFTERDDALGRGVRSRLLDLVRKLKDENVPLHAVGLQGHLQPQYPANDEAFTAFLEELAKLGVEIYITELDCDDISFPDDPAERDARVAQRYEAFLKHALSVPAVTMVVTWQLADRYSWYRDPAVLAARRTSRAPRPLPFDTELRPKPARDAMLRAFRSRTT